MRPFSKHLLRSKAVSPAILLFLAVSSRLFAVEHFTYWIEPCPGSDSRCEQADDELARWALEAWQKASGGGLIMSRSSEERARIRIYWASGRAGLYGEARGILVDGKSGAELYIRPTLDGLGPEIAALGAKDKLFRQTIVYLTALHELGHALGLPHTRGFEDIMYNFAFGGDILEYFGRYRRKIRSRDGIPDVSGLSEDDIRRLRSIYRAHDVP